MCIKNVCRDEEVAEGLMIVGPVSETFTERGSLRARSILLGRSIFAAAAVFVATGLSTFRAFGDIPVSFQYNFGAETGTARSVQDPVVAAGITFSGLTLHNVFKSGSLIGPWPVSPPGLAPGWPNNPSDPYVSFTIFAPSGYRVDVTGVTDFTPHQTQATVSLSGPGTSEEIRIGAVDPILSRDRVFGELSGQATVTVVPEPSTLLGGTVAAGLVLFFLVRRSRQGRSLAACVT